MEEEMKKVLIIFILFLTGCQVNYNLVIDDNTVVESSDFLSVQDIDVYNKSDYMAYFDMDLKKDYLYEKKIIDNGLNLSFTYDGTNFEKSSLLDKCYYKKSFIKDDSYIILYTEGGARCFYEDGSKLLDSLNINIKTSLEVLDNNADQVSGNNYIWKLDENNYMNKDIYIKIKRASGTKNVILPVIIVFVIIITMLVIFKVHDKKR